MSTATDTVVVQVPTSTAYNQWTQMESYPEFMTGVERVEQIDDTHLRWTMGLGGVQREFDVVITEQVPDSHIAWRSTGEVKQSGRVEFRPVSTTATQVTLQVDWEPTGAAEQIGKAMQVDDAMVAGDLQRFKSLIEDQGTSDGAWRGEVHHGRPTG